MRILHLVSNLGKNSGVMNVIMNYYRHINRGTLQFDFCYFLEKKNSYESEIKSLGGNVFYFAKPNINFRYLIDLDYIIKRYEKRYDVIHIHECFMTILVYPVLKKNKIQNVIAHCHNAQYGDSKTAAFRNKLLCLPINHIANYHYACSYKAGKFMFGSRFGESRNSRVINNAIDCNRFKFSKSSRDQVRNLYNIDDELVIGHVGRFNPQKNHSFIVDIFKAYHSFDVNSKLILVGEGPLQKEIQTKVDKLGLSDCVIFAGSQQDIPAYLNAMDVFLMPSLFERLPVSAIEAQASGLPVVMSTEITVEVGVDNYIFIDLSNKIEQWTDAIFNKSIKSTNREEAYLTVQNKGFDIKNEAHKLMYEYSNLIDIQL